MVKVMVEQIRGNQFAVYRCDTAGTNEAEARKAGYVCHGTREVIKALFKILPAIPEGVEVAMRKAEDTMFIENRWRNILGG